MANINLRPWREERRKQRSREVQGLMVATLIFAFVVAFGWVSYMDSQVSAQQARNDYLDQEIAKLDQRIAQIRDLQNRLDALLARVEVIQNLEAERTIIVRTFDQLVDAMPRDVYLRSFVLQGNNYRLSGQASSPANVSLFLDNLDEGAPLIGNLKLPDVTSITDATGNVTGRNFLIEAKKINPAAQGGE